MPRIPPQVLYSPFYLYPSVRDAEQGERFGGTGFFVAYPTGEASGSTFLYAVTNWHVAVRDGASVIRVNKINGGVDIFEFDPSEWEFPPGEHDLAVMPHYKLKVRESIHEIVALHLNLFLTKPEVAALGIAPGEDIFMVGRFVDHDGAASNVPSARFGNISVMPQPVTQPTGAKLESFILDVHSRTGYSGSPVFVYRTFGSDLTTDQLTNKAPDFFTQSITVRPEDHFVKLLGLHWGQFPEQWEIKTQKRPSVGEINIEADARYIEGMSGMTLAVPAWAIREFLDMPKFRDARAEGLKILSARSANRGPIAESCAPPPSDENPTHREDFMRLVDAAARKPPQAD